MKYSKLILTLTVFLAFLSCSEEEVLTTNFNTVHKENSLENASRSISCNNSQTNVNVIYDTSNPDWQNNSILVRQNYKMHMSQYFTIISITANLLPECRHTEIWVVDCEEYESFLNISRTSGGTADNYSDEAELRNPIDSTGDCF